METSRMTCKSCGIATASPTATFCGAACQGEFMRRHGAATAQRRRRDAASEASAHALLALHARRDRCSTHWERAVVDSEIDRVNALFAAGTTPARGS
jgi:hypothetical protein